MLTTGCRTGSQILEDIVALCCQAWNNLIDQPWKIMSLGMRGRMGSDQ